MAFFLKRGDTFSGCEILSLCGRGAFGVTYLARNPLGRRIAIKIVGATDRPDRELNGIRNYMRIAESHPDLLQIFHVGETEDGFFYTMEAADDCGTGPDYLPATLGNLMRLGRKFSPDEAVGIARELLAGAGILHDAGLIHRDIKPDNIIFIGGKPKLSDPGLVITEGEPASLAGTPGFIPPEMIENAAPADRQADLYAIGKVFYCMITGYSPGRYPELPKDMPVEICRQIFPALSAMCNRDPSKRFPSAAAFRAGLPEKFARPTRLEKFRTDFRDWRLLNPGKARLLLGAIVTACLLLTAAAAGAAFWHVRELRLSAERQRYIDAFLAIDGGRKSLLRLQLEVYAPEAKGPFERLSRKLENARRRNDLKQAAAYCRNLRDLLSSLAAKLLPSPAVKADALPGDFSSVAAVRGFLSTPLAAYLDPGLEKDCRKRLADAEEKVYLGWSGPRCDRDWDTHQDYDHPMVFVPPGAVRMRHSGKIARIPYHFWMCRIEISHEGFTRLLDLAPQKSPFPNTPLERASWNDILFYCFQIDKLLRSRGQLPPGYIVRPPTEEEWEYAAENAWLGPDTAPLEDRAVIKSNSNNRSMPPGSKLPNKLGLLDMYGNVAEIVRPFEKPALHNAVMVRGGSYRSKHESCFRQVPYLMYQFIPFDIGSRMVIAPGDASYYDRHFFLSGPVQLRTRGKVYELIGGNVGSFTWETSHDLCQLLGGRLAEIEDQDHLDFFIRNMPLAAGGWGCFIGGKKTGGKWKWLRSGREIDFGKWHPAARENDGKNYLTLREKKWKPEKDYRSGIFLCEWDEKDFPRRNDQLLTGKKLPGELERFTVGDRTFMLIDSPMLWNAACRFCELLGGRLACPETPELREALIRKLDAYRDRRIMLGGYAKRDKWFWLSGKECTLKLKKDNDFPIPSRNRNFVMLKEGEFYDAQYGRLFLCEWPNRGLRPRVAGNRR